MPSKDPQAKKDYDREWRKRWRVAQPEKYRAQRKRKYDSRMARRGDELRARGREQQRARYKPPPPRPFVEIKCILCGGVRLTQRPKTTKYCSDLCSQRAWRALHPVKVRQTSAEYQRRMYREDPVFRAHKQEVAKAYATAFSVQTSGVYLNKKYAPKEVVDLAYSIKEARKAIKEHKAHVSHTR